MKRYVFAVMSVEKIGVQIHIDAETMAEAWYKITSPAIAEYGNHLESIELVTIIEL